MKKGNVILVLSMMMATLVFVGCGGPTPEEQALQNLAAISEIQEGVMSGEISDDQAEAMLDEMQSEIAEEAGRDVDSFPGWAKAIGFEEPKGLEFEYGEETTESRDGYNSVTLEYTGDYDVSMAEAKRIAEKADVPSDLQDALSGMLEGMEGMEDAMGDMKIGAIYTNLDLTSSGLSDGGRYQKTISVDENGDFEVIVLDFDKYKEVAKNHGMSFGDL